MDKENKLILYKDEEGKVSVNTRFADEFVAGRNQHAVIKYKQNVCRLVINVNNRSDTVTVSSVDDFKSDEEGKHWGLVLRVCQLAWEINFTAG